MKKTSNLNIGKASDHYYWGKYLHVNTRCCGMQQHQCLSASHP